MAGKRGAKPKSPKQAESYKHSEATNPMRPDVGTQAQFRKKKPPTQYRYDSSLSPSMEWDDSPAREQAEALIRQIQDAETLEEAKAAAAKLRAMGEPFLNWAGKAEHQSFDVPTLPLFVHERLSTAAILETIRGHKRTAAQGVLDLFGDPQHSISDQVLRAYEHQDQWVNRMILGDSLVVMNSLLQYEGLGGKVQTIYMDPPYGVKFGSNFQPFVRNREVKHGDDEHMSREPEMVRAYRDTWEMGLHSYLAYMRDRLCLCRELLAPTGSIFVQIGDANVHHVRELMDEVFESENMAAMVTFRKGMPLSSSGLSTNADFVLWYARNREHTAYHPLHMPKRLVGDPSCDMLELPDGTSRRLTAAERLGDHSLPPGARSFGTQPMHALGYYQHGFFNVEHAGAVFAPPPTGWKTTKDGMTRLAELGRLVQVGRTLRYKLYLDDHPVSRLTNIWTDLVGAQDKSYVVQTAAKVIERCILMTSAPGDLVLDPTCGSGTTAYVAEQWGRRWITTDVSRVPLALARQRLLTATYSYYELQDEKRGPAGGFIYKRKQNRKGDEVGGIVPHVTLKSVAHDEEPDSEVLVDRPEEDKRYVRVTGPFAVEAMIPTAMDLEEISPHQLSAQAGREQEDGESHAERMIRILRASPVLRLGGNQQLTLRNVRPMAQSMALHAEAAKSAEDAGGSVAIVFGPAHGAISEQGVFEAAREAYAKSYSHLYVIGFAIHPNARKLVEDCAQAVGISATYIQATPDVLMGDLLKNMRSSQIFSVCGLPDVTVKKNQGDGGDQYRVELLGLDVFDPITQELEGRGGDDVPAWFLDTDYNGLCFHVCQAFFPRTSAWDSLKKALKADFEETVWDHLSGTVSAAFEAGEHEQIAVKVIDDRGNELVVVKKLSEAV